MAFLELIKTIGAAFGTEIKPIGGIDPSSLARGIVTDASGNIVSDRKRYGEIYAVGNNSTVAIAAAAYKPVLSIRVKVAATQLITPLTITSVVSARSIWVALLNPTLTGASWASVSTGVEYDIAATAYSGGTKIYHAPTNDRDVFDSIWDFASPIAAGNIITIIAKTLGGNGQFAAGIQWREW